MDHINDYVTSLKDNFKKFTLAHNNYHETLTEETDIDAGDNYFSEKQRKYVSALNLVKDSKKTAKAKAKPIFGSTGSDSD
ncbi:hypothetical protein HOLleu_01118 [Holothuria leucospilota]|uniref:Uncharacterized protein n=1 Tax=Holothuria leucospilota TaxID=206669 RepID=A0A9Q1CPW3_HOLLE|nr:hypothetical protein HOLleu_01118 [Holothuria leucospilota]